MNAKDWVVCLIEPNKWEAQIIVDLLRNAGVDRIKTFADTQAAMQGLELYSANVVVGSLEMTPMDGIAWTRAFRRNHNAANRKAAVFLTSRAFSRSVAEECRHAGVNALIGKPVSGATILATIKKVLTNPRQFIDAENYIGPCRRAGIVTAGAGTRRRMSDADAPAARAPAPAATTAPESTLAAAVAHLGAAVANMIKTQSGAEGCAAALALVQGIAGATGDGPLLRACAAFALHLTARDLKPDAMNAGLAACMAGLSQLAATAVEEAEKRDAVAESVRQAVAKAAMQKAA